MRTSEKGINLIKKYEGCRLTAYKCPAGVWTIGFGHTRNVKKGMKISKDKAIKYLLEDIAIYEIKVDKYNKKYKWTQNEFDALVSFAFNIGSINKLTKYGTRTKKQIATSMLKYVKANGKTLKGLERRRKEEYNLFLGVDN